MKRVKKLQDNLITDLARALQEIEAVKINVIELAERSKDDVTFLVEKYDELLVCQIQHIERGIAFLQKGQQDIKDQVQQEGFKLLKNKDILLKRIRQLRPTIEGQRAIADSVSKNLKLKTNTKYEVRSREETVCILGRYTCEREDYTESETKQFSAAASSEEEPEVVCVYCPTLFPEQRNENPRAAPVHATNHGDKVITQEVGSFRPLKGFMSGMQFTRNYDFFGVERNSEEVVQYSVSRDYRFTFKTRFGKSKLEDPWEVDQLPDGRVVVCDGVIGHSVKIFVLELIANGHVLKKT